MHRDDPRLLDYITKVLDRFFVRGERSSDVVFPGNRRAKLDAFPEFIAPMLVRNELHDPDYAIFRAFRGRPDDVILDVGANWGYSVASIWASGADCRVVSFEPWLPYRACLARIADLRPGRFDFRMVGLGNTATTLKFAVPMVNDVAVVALATASQTPQVPIIAENVRLQIQQWMPTVLDANVTVHEFEARVERLDDLLRDEPLLGKRGRIAAIKIDVEGLEREVVEGSLETLARHKPLVLIEAGNRSAGVTELFSSVGYFYAERRGDQLRPVHEISRTQNGFFVHSAMIAEYKHAGILADASFLPFGAIGRVATLPTGVAAGVDDGAPLLRKDAPLRASVCIATHKRPDGLERLLTSLTKQSGAPPFEVVVVDNDAGRSGEPVARRFIESLRLTYVVEPVRGLARVRNRAVTESTGEFIAFIDDDEWATERWLAELEARANERAADVVIGPVTLIFDEEVPAHVRSCSLFQRNQIADGEPVPWNSTHTSNAYVRRNALPDQSSPFSSRFDLTGGEDVDLFSRMIGSGASVIAATRAEVFEHRPLRRANMYWLLRRSMRNGNNTIAMEWNGLGTARLLRMWLGAGYRGLSEGIKGLHAWRRDRATGTAHFLKMAERFGRVTGLLGIRIREYRNHP